MIYRPHPYQESATRLILDKPAVALWLDMGMGKTVSTLTAVAELMHNRVEVSPCLVIAPLRVARDTWSREVEKWEHLQYLKVSQILGTREDRIRAIEDDADIYVINRENVPWLVEFFKKDWPYELVVIDESSSFKSPSSKRFKALRKVRPFIKRIVELTGTPSPNGLMDLWSQVYLLDGGMRLGKTLGEYRRTYFQEGRRNGHIVYEYVPLPNADERIRAALSDVAFSMSASDWLALPDRIDAYDYVDLGENQDTYNQLERDLVMSLDEGDIVATNAAVLAGKLLQLANGAIYDTEGNVRIVHDQKMEALDSIIEESGSVLVFYSFRHDLERIRKKYPTARVLEGPKDIEDWNKGRIKTLLAHPASSGHGLNLQDGGHVIAWFGLPWSLELYQQANARLHRQGQKKSVIVHHILARKTMDERVMKALKAKKTGQDDLLKSLKAYIEEKTQQERK